MGAQNNLMDPQARLHEPHSENHCSRIFRMKIINSFLSSDVLSKIVEVVADPSPLQHLARLCTFKE
jgi:hypothetical protein